MPIDVTTVQSDGWWAKRLWEKLAARRPRAELLWAYYSGRPPLPEGAQQMRESYQAFQRKARTNYAELIVEAPQQRMIPQGFRTGAEGDDNGDAAARAIWMGNGLDVESAEVHRAMLTTGDAYVIVGHDGTSPIITAESPTQVITEHDPVRQRKVIAALKSFHDPLLGEEFLYLYLPGRVVVARRSVSAVKDLGTFQPARWDWDEDLSKEFAHDVVPVVRFRNKGGVGEFEPHLDHLDRINHMLLQRLVVATSQAFRQRGIKGNLPERDEAGNLIDYDKVFSADPGALWELPDGIDVWESQQTSFQDMLASVRDDVKDLAAVTFTPLHYFTPDAASGSAEGAALAREGLVFKTEDRIARVKDAWAQVMSLAFRFAGDTQRSELASLEAIFASPERHSLAERYDAATKAQSVGVPWETIMSEILQYSPEAVRQMLAKRGQDLIFQVTAPAAIPAAPRG